MFSWRAIVSVLSLLFFHFFMASFGAFLFAMPSVQGAI